MTGITQKPTPAPPTIYALSVSDMILATEEAQDRIMDGYCYLRRRGYTRFDMFTAHNAGHAIESGSMERLHIEEADARYCESRFFTFE